MKRQVVWYLVALFLLVFAGCGDESFSTADNPGGLAWPIDCKPDRTCVIGNYPDLEQNPDGIGAFCTPQSIAGHQGTDIGISWLQMDHGVDVYAAADGIVKWAWDGKFDRCPDSFEPDCENVEGGGTVCTEMGPYCGDGTSPGQCSWCFAGGNVVVILHETTPGVFATRYDHLKKGSVLVRAGDRVVKGQKIAQVGSAGRSTGPHLHFEVWGTGYAKTVDPWVGPCSDVGKSALWESQDAIRF